MALLGQNYTFRGSGTGGGGGAATFKPERTLFVSPAWPVGNDPLVFFNTITLAIAHALTLTPAPSPVDPVLVEVFPGEYSEDILLASGVFVFGHVPNSVILDNGTVGWGPLGGGDDVVGLSDVRIGAGSGLFINTGGKSGGNTRIDLRNVDIDAATLGIGVQVLGRLGNGDTMRWWNGSHGVGTHTYTRYVLEAYDQKYTGPVTINGDSHADVSGSSTGDAWTIGDSANVTLRGSQADAAINVASGCSLSMPGSKLNSLLTVAAGGGADLRMCEYGQGANLAGAGEVDRSIWQTTFGPTAAGDNVVPIAPIMATVNYVVVLTQVSGAAASARVTAQAQGSFTLSDAAGGHIWSIAILRQ